MLENTVISEFTTAIDIYAYLTEHRSLTREKQSTLFDSYTDEEIQQLVKLIAQRYKTRVELIKNTIYLIPERDNRLFSYTKGELKNAIFKSSNYNETDFNLANFIILELLTTFYNSTSDELAMFQVSYNEFENRVNLSIKKACEYNLEELENEHNIAFINIINKWSSLKGSDNQNKVKDTRYGFMSKVLLFLNNEKLIVWYESDGIIAPTTRLTDLVCGVILYKPEFKNAEALFDKLKSQENLTIRKESE
ncbi:hypothetical protein CHL78_005825 [Romboutsia weinsteinii]|uniref:Uncharacterized protein n=1 Tax=Romboutsia weinsteinii TaxID=2020949 RepID=A0A371J6P4_9FIRM|nr:DUF6063 family protein [Romboutsia weinsteinii]RDY28415.1 hypothetical protein CHL78_005825 [Romboutsia weinsteinii]